MRTLRVAENSKFFSKLFFDKSLTKKASLNALAAALEYGARLIVGFVVTPLLVAGLGNFYYGTWQVLLRLTGSISPATGRATQALKWTLANKQSSSDYEEKRRYVGSALAVWAFFLPLLTLLGGMLAWFVPNLINAPAEFLWPVRLAAGLLVLHVIMTSLALVPRSVLEGENLGYKRMGLSAILVFVGGGFTCLALYFETGIVGVAAAALATAILTGVFFLQVVRTYAPWFGASRPSFDGAWQFLGLSWWFVGWNLIMNLMMASDVIVLGMLRSAESVTNYTLTKYTPETLITIVAIMVSGISPGLGGIIGSGDLEKASRVRGEIMSLTWLVVTGVGSTILLWNRAFVGLWVGTTHYAGSIPTLLIVLVVMQFVLLQNDASFIDLTLNLRRKVVMGALSVTLSLLAAGVLLRYFNLGIPGLCLGLIAGRSILSAGYPVLVGRFLKVSLSSQLRGVLRPAFVTVLLFLLAWGLDCFSSANNWIPVNGWIGLVLSVGGTFGGVLLLTFYAGLSGNQRRQVMRRVRIVVAIDRDRNGVIV